MVILGLLALILTVLGLILEEKSFKEEQKTLRALHKQRALKAQERLVRMGLIKEIPHLED